MTRLGFKRYASDRSVSIKWMNGKRIIVLTYADDLISMTGSDTLRIWWRDELDKRFKDATHEPNIDLILT